MKHSELDLDTVYADHDGRPVMVLSLEKFAKPRRTYGAAHIRRVDSTDKSFGVLVVRSSYRNRDGSIDDLIEHAQTLREPLPETEDYLGLYEVKVESLRLLVETWDDRLVRLQVEKELREAKASKEAALREHRAALIEKITGMLPADLGVRMGLGLQQGYVPVSLASFHDLLAAAAPVERTEGETFTPREMSLLAAGFEAAIACITYSDGTPVELVGVKNPYRAERS